MSGINRAIIIGHLGADPEVKEHPTGPRATMRVATSESWKDREGQRQERTEWHNVVAFGRTAELAGQYLQKGRQVCVEGRMSTRKWEGDDGKDRYFHEIVARHITFLGGGNKARGEAAVNDARF